MIQRIQSLFLLIVTVLLFIMILSPQAVFFDRAGNLYQLTYFGIAKYFSSGWVIVEQTLVNAIFITSCIIVSVMCIVLYKNRKKQIRTCQILIIFLCLLSIVIFYSYWMALKHFLYIKSSLLLPSLFPVISVILVFMAIKSIKKDEELVKSSDRIR